MTAATAPKRVEPKSNTSRWQWRMTIIFAVVILIPSMYGFVGKFVELVHVFQGESGGEFAIAPMLNYLLASLGFLCMLVWATSNGMFHDVERAKVEMLEHERLLDQDDARAHR